MEEKLRQRPCDCLKIVLFGPESTGKTTLSEELGKIFNEPVVPEFMREYLQKVWDHEKRICEPKDIIPIAEGQMELENRLSKEAEELLISDTNLLELKVYSEAYYEAYCDPKLLKHALNNHYDYYFLTYIDVPWTPDDLRDKPHDREGMFQRFENELKQQKIPYMILKGTWEQRLQTAVAKINQLLKSKIIVNFSEQDIQQIEEKGLTTSEVEEQIKIFKRGNIKVNITEAATIGKGISKIEEAGKKELIAFYDSEKEKHSILKFIPASGAATRMFKALHNFNDEFNPESQSLREYLDEKGDKDLQRFFTKIEELPFYEHAIEKAKKNHPGYDDKSDDEKNKIFVETVLEPDGLYLSDLPKGLVPFHKYDSHIATAFEEHLLEAAKYVTVNGITKLHFTVAEGDKEKFQREWREIQERIEKKTGVKFDIQYSYQDPKTDTIAVDENFEPFRTTEGELFFRPGGHGALVENLNRLQEEIVFLKNIDNVVTENYVNFVADYKKMLGGKLFKIQETIFNYLKMLEDNDLPEDKLNEITSFLEKELFIKSSSGKFSASQLKEILHRPLRVCGMVKNEGEPGGGPFLVKDSKGGISLQIIEGAQIDEDNPEQVKTAKEATHFSPVDIVCCLRDHQGKEFDLHKYVDEDMSFIADKTKDGKPLKALERPGLWNGGMAKWNTVFVEVPVETFNPVKTVADLLKDSHQPA